MQLIAINQNTGKHLLSLILFTITGCSTSELTKYELGLKNYTDEKYRSAVEYFTRAIWEDPTNSELYFLRGNAEAKLDHNQEAITDYSTAIKLEPEMKYYENRGLTYLEIRDYQSAIKDFNEALTFDSAYSVLYFNLGYTEALSGNYDIAIMNYTKAIHLDSTNAKTFVNRGDLWAGVGEHQKAVFDFTAALSLNVNDELAYFNRANEFVAIGLFENAIDDYSRAIALNPVNVKYYFLRAELKAGAGKFLSAAADYTKLISIEPKNGNAYYNRGICYANIALKNNACDDFNQAGELGFFEAYEIIKKYCENEEEKK
jgi:tetratricopeptide (TPR) repeat protein